MGPSAAWSHSYADARDAAAPDYELGIALTVARRCVATVAGSLLAYPRDDPICRLRAGSPHPHPRSAPGVLPGRSVGTVAIGAELQRDWRHNSGGPLIGGLVTSFISWRASFNLQVLIVVAIIWLGARHRGSTAASAAARIRLARRGALGGGPVLRGLRVPAERGLRIGHGHEGLRDRRHCDHPSGRYLAGIGPANPEVRGFP